jgi:hypothetical protein
MYFLRRADCGFLNHHLRLKRVSPDGLASYVDQLTTILAVCSL